MGLVRHNWLYLLLGFGGVAFALPQTTAFLTAHVDQNIAQIVAILGTFLSATGFVSIVASHEIRSGLTEIKAGQKGLATEISEIEELEPRIADVQWALTD